MTDIHIPAEASEKSMIKPEQVPKAAAKSVCDLFDPGYLESIGLNPESIIAAALNAWPEAGRVYGDTDGMWFESVPDDYAATTAIILPITEPTDDR